MTLIEFLNKKANGEETPKKFKFEGETYEENEYGFIKDEDGYNLFVNICYDLSNINYEIEILDKEDEFVDIEELKTFNYSTFKEMSSEQRFEVTLDEYLTINNVIKNQKLIIEKLKEKE